MLHPNIIRNYNNNKMKLISDKQVNVIADFTDDVDVNYSKQTLAMVKGSDFIINKDLQEEIFGPFSLLVECDNMSQLKSVVNKINGQLTGTIIASDNEISSNKDLIDILKERVGRIILNGVPTGVEVNASMLHGGPYPASTNPLFTSVGAKAILRFRRPITYQNFPQNYLSPVLRDGAPELNNARINGK